MMFFSSQASKQLNDLFADQSSAEITCLTVASEHLVYVFRRLDF